ncbi:MAG: septum formation initiator family protein [Oscillospiraceae bacterium]|nr:septum formation initiator family protein [Oscillospiraceae bacterium]
MVLVFVLFLFVYEVANNRAEVKRSSESLAIAQEELRRYTIENEQLRRYAQGENLDDYLDRFARDEMGYADPQERVYRIEPEK